MTRLSASRRGYDHRWRIRSKHFLQRNPLCVMCEKEGKLTVATIVDHIRPHRGDPVLFNDVRNWQPLCKAHHDRTKQRIDVHGYSTEVDPAQAYTETLSIRAMRDERRGGQTSGCKMVIAPEKQ